MESIHGVDVSWMQHSSKDHNGRQRSTSDASLPKESPKSSQNGVGNGHAKEPPPATPKSIQHRPGFTRSNSTSEKTATLNGTGGSLPKSTTTPSPINNTRRNSWLSTISSKFSSSPNHANTTPPANGQVPASPPAQELYLQKQQTPPYMKTAILSPGIKEVGDEPYTPAPPKQTQPNFLQSALRRLSSSSGQLTNSGKPPQHGLCQRRTLNVDHHRERCSIAELDQSKLRRVAFCVDVEIASGPKYIDEDEDESKDLDKKQDKKDKKKKVAERGEGEALKHPDDLKSEKENDGVVKATGEKLPKEPEKEGKSATQSTKEVKEDPPSPPNEKQDTKKKEKKKRSEEERKARKEKKRRLAEANGILPVEMMRNISDDSLSGGTPGTPKTQASPTTDPVRIYRRCCQLRETPILKKITEQLAMPSNNSGLPGVVNKLDLTGYWLQLPDLITLGDYLAVVPVKELIMENTGLTDEGVRVILAGLLAAKSPEFPVIRRAKAGQKDGECPQQGGIVERVVLKNNTQIDQVGWRHICLFIHMCRSLKYMDLSQVPLPQPPASSATSTPTSHHPHLPHMKRTISQSSVTSNISSILAKAIGERLGGSELELLNMAECGITTEQLGCLVDGICKSGLRRLGVAGNNITAEGIQHIARYLKSGICEGLDLGGNDLKATLEILVEAIDEDNPLYALSVAACNLTPDSLWKLFPALARLKNFRFIDLSQNHDLFESKPSAIPLLRRYLPRLPLLKRIHLTDVSLMPEQAIALAEILPESPSLAHINIMENKQVAALASAKGEANQEEACALYASLMAAVRVSKSIICIDIEVPSTDSSEVVKALAKQVVAYCLFNMERGPVAEIGEAVTAIPEPHGSEKGVAVPDVLLHLVGHDEGAHPSDDDDEPAPDEDYVIGGTGVVKALGICLGNRGNDSRPSHDRTFSDFSEAGGSAAPKSTRVSGGKAKDMSKNLLGSARKIRARLQPALAKEARTGDRHNYTRLLFLDQTLEGMIKRFEDEFPETRLPATVPATSPPAFPNVTSKTSEPSEKGSDDGDTTLVDEHRLSEDEDDVIRPMLSRHNSDVSLASKALSQEEGRMHRFGQKLRRDILKPQTESHVQDTNGTGKEADHLQFLRKMVEDMGGDVVKRKVETEGEEEVIKELSNEASLLRQQLKDSDPEGWERFVQSQEAAQRNSSIIGHVIPTTLEDAKAEDSSAIE